MKNTELIKKLTLEEKASLTSGKDFWQTMNIDRVGLPSAFLADGPHGLRKQAVAADHLGLNQSIPSTCFPPAATVANSFNLELLNKMGTAIGREAKANKVSVLLGPGINIKRNPRCGRNFEYFSEDPYLAGKLASAFITGAQSNGIHTCVKHYAANNQEFNRMVSDSIVDERTLREIYLSAFEMAIVDGKSRSIMSAYNKINGVYANENPFILDTVLREEWGFEGFVISDWGGNNDRIKALAAGSNLEMPTTGGETNIDIINAIENGTISESLLDKNIDQLITGVLLADKALKEETIVDYVEHHITALRIAEESIVLLKNKNDILPLEGKKDVAIIGDFAYSARYQGAGSSIVNPAHLEQTLDVLEEYDLNVVATSKGFKRYGKLSKSLVKQSIKVSKKVETVILYIGLDEITESEGLDRKDIQLPPNQLTLIDALHRAGKRIVAVLSCGTPIEMNWIDKVDAVVHGYLGGQAGAKAILNVITGKANPSGKLAETYPLVYADVPNAKYFHNRNRSSEYREGLFVGYRYYNTRDIPVRFPFGFGLSYTSYQYSDLRVTKDKVIFKIKNIGNREGKEVAQLYIGKKNSVLPRPVSELKGFIKVSLKPNEEKLIEIPFDRYSFRYFDINTKKFEIESGIYSIGVGTSSRDIVLLGTLDVEGTIEKTFVYNNLTRKYLVGDVNDVSSVEFSELIGREIPEEELVFVKRNRIIVDINTTIAEMRYAKGWLGRFLSWGIKTAYKLLWGLGKKSTANVLLMGVYNNPIRCLSRLTGAAISWKQLEGLVVAFNGRFWKGMRMFFKAGGERKKAEKAKRGADKKRKKERNNSAN